MRSAAAHIWITAATCCSVMVFLDSAKAQQYTSQQCSQITAQIQEYQRVLPAYDARGQGSIIRQGIQSNQAAYNSGCRGGGSSAYSVPSVPMPTISVPSSRAGQYSGSGSRARSELDGMSLDDTPPTKNARPKSAERTPATDADSSGGLSNDASSPNAPEQDDLSSLREKVRENTDKIRQQIETSIEDFVDKDVDSAAISTAAKQARELIDLANDPQGEISKKVDEAGKDFVADAVVGDAAKDPDFGERAKDLVKERYDHIEGQLKEAKKELVQGMENAGENIRGFEDRLKENVEAIKNIKTNLTDYFNEKFDEIKQGADRVSGK